MAPKKAAAAPAKKAPAKAPAKKAAKPAAKAAGKGPAKKGTGKKDTAKKEVRKKGKRHDAKYEPLFESRPRNHSVGQDLPPRKQDLTRFVKWPAYVKKQRQKRVLFKRLRIPPAINQFQHTTSRHERKELFKFALKYKPETVLERRKRLKAEAEAKVKDPKAKATVAKPRLYCGIQRVFRLVEQKRAKLVLIAHDVEPIELVLCLPALCKKQGIPYCIVRGKSNLGRLVNFKTATCVAFVDIANADKPTFEKLVESIKTGYLARYEEANRKWGGLRLSRSSIQIQKKKKKLAQAAESA